MKGRQTCIILCVLGFLLFPSVYVLHISGPSKVAVRAGVVSHAIALDNPGLSHETEVGEDSLRPLLDIIPTAHEGAASAGYEGAGIAAIVTLVGIFLLWTRRRRGLRKEIPLGPGDLARQEIADLEALGLIEKGKTEEFYFTLSQITKRYMEALGRIPGLGCTTQEIATCLQKWEDTKILDFLQRTDLVKFAKATPDQSQRTKDLATVLEYIAATASLQTAGHTDQRAI